MSRPRTTVVDSEGARVKLRSHLEDGDKIYVLTAVSGG